MKEPLENQMDKIMGELKQSHNSFKKLETKYLHTKFFISSLAPRFNKFHQNFQFLKI